MSLYSLPLPFPSPCRQRRPTHFDVSRSSDRRGHALDGRLDAITGAAVGDKCSALALVCGELPRALPWRREIRLSLHAASVQCAIDCIERCHWRAARLHEKRHAGCFEPALDIRRALVARQHLQGSEVSDHCGARSPDLPATSHRFGDHGRALGPIGRRRDHIDLVAAGPCAASSVMPPGANSHD